MNNGTSTSYTNTGMYVALSLYGILGLAIVVANALVLFLVFMNQNLRSPTNSYLVSLAVSDISTGVLAIPFTITCSLTVQESTCIGMDVFVRFLAFSSVAHLTVLTLDRFVRITKPFLYRSYVTISKTKRVIGVMWSFSLVCSLSQLIWITNESISLQNMLKIDIIYDSISCGITVALPLLVISALYIAIFKYIRRSNIKRSQVISSQKRIKTGEKRLLLVFLAMIVVFILGSCMYFTWALIMDLYEYHDIRFTRLSRDIFVTAIMFFASFPRFVILCF